MTNRFHQAAKDGYLDLLREATKKDCNRLDEDGRTPTMYAAMYGNTDALRLIVSRGGDPDKCDYLGNTPLHMAAATGHINCVTFLVSFGCNIWGLDNDHCTALDVAAVQQRMDIVNFLDGVAGRQGGLNKKVVKRLKEKAVKDADERIKKYNKMTSKQEKRMEKEQKKLEKQHDHEYVKNSKLPKPADHYSKMMSTGHKSYIDKRIEQKKQMNGTFAGFQYPMDDGNKRSVRSTTNASVVMTGDVSNPASRAPLTSDLFHGNSHLSSKSEPYLNHDSGIDSYGDETDKEGSSLYDRPGFGNLMFLPKGASSTAMMSLPDEIDKGMTNDVQDPDDTIDDTVNIEHQNNGSAARSRYRGSSGKALPWDEDELEDLDDDDNDSLSSPLELFLAAHGLTDYLPLFTQEQIDLDALMLCSDNDLKSIHVPLGPRRKVLEAIARRKAVLSEPGCIADTEL
ncbi:pre-mRNA splicing regulator USH1G-like [Glandiceps talaboti]